MDTTLSKKLLMLIRRCSGCFGGIRYYVPHILKLPLLVQVTRRLTAPFARFSSCWAFGHRQGNSIGRTFLKRLTDLLMLQGAQAGIDVIDGVIRWLLGHAFICQVLLPGLAPGAMVSISHPASRNSFTSFSPSTSRVSKILRAVLTPCEWLGIV